MSDLPFTVQFARDVDTDRAACFRPGCGWDPNYWYVDSGKRIGLCFGHATEEVMTSGRYGRRERKERP